MNSEKFLRLAIDSVVVYFNKSTAERDNTYIGRSDVYVVWSCKTLQNNKALLSTTIPDGMYYEVTYNGDKKECYIDAYRKVENSVVKVED